MSFFNKVTNPSETTVKEDAIVAGEALKKLGINLFNQVKVKTQIATAKAQAAIKAVKEELRSK